MPYIATRHESDLYPGELAKAGYIANSVRLFAHRPAVYAAWRQLVGAIMETMDPRRYELVTLAAAGELRSSYCALAHGKVLAENWFSPAEVVAIAGGRTDALDAVDVAVMEFAERVVSDAASITQEDVERLRAAGLADDEILDVAIAAGARCFFSKTLDALGVQPDSGYRDLEPGLRHALVVGRPIAND